MPKKKIENCSFFLKDAKAISPTLIYFHCTLPDGRLKRSLGRSIAPGAWDFIDQRPAPTKDKAIREIEQIIQQIIDVIPVIQADCRRNNKVISRADINAALDIILQKRTLETPAQALPAKDMFTDFETIIAGMEDGTILTPGKNKKRYSAATIKNYEKSVRKITAFYADEKLPAIWSGVTMDLYNSFLTWCHGENQSNNSIGVFIKCWKRMGRVALKKGWHTNMIFEDEEFMILKEDTDDIYLDESKIEKIYKQPVPERHYDIARDWFILDCYLGLRVSDLGRVAAKDFTGDYFQFVNQKTGAHVTIKMNRYVKAIIKKWKGLPPGMSDVKLNAYIKTVAKMAGLKKKFIYKITKGGVLVTETLEEWQMVSSHTCRRSFITNLLKMGEPHARVMKLAGIKRYETLMRYFKETAEDVARESGKGKFFE